METAIISLMKLINPDSIIVIVLILYIIVYQKIKIMPDMAEVKADIKEIKEKYVTKDHCNTIHKYTNGV